MPSVLYTSLIDNERVWLQADLRALQKAMVFPYVITRICPSATYSMLLTDVSKVSVFTSSMELLSHSLHTLTEWLLCLLSEVRGKTGEGVCHSALTGWFCRQQQRGSADRCCTIEPFLWPTCGPKFPVELTGTQKQQPDTLYHTQNHFLLVQCLSKHHIACYLYTCYSSTFDLQGIKFHNCIFFFGAYLGFDVSRIFL